MFVQQQRLFEFDTGRSSPCLRVALLLLACLIKSVIRKQVLTFHDHSIDFTSRSHSSRMSLHYLISSSVMLVSFLFYFRIVVEITFQGFQSFLDLAFSFSQVDRTLELDTASLALLGVLLDRLLYLLNRALYIAKSLLVRIVFFLLNHSRTVVQLHVNLQHLFQIVTSLNW